MLLRSPCTFLKKSMNSMNYQPLVPEPAVHSETACLIILRAPPAGQSAHESYWMEQVARMQAAYESSSCGKGFPEGSGIWDQLKLLDLPGDARRIAVFMHDSVEGVYALEMPFRPGLYPAPRFDIREVAFHADLFNGFFAVQLQGPAYHIYLMDSHGFTLPIDVSELGPSPSESWMQALDCRLEQLLKMMLLPVLLSGDPASCGDMRRASRNAKHIYGYMPGSDIATDPLKILEKMHGWMKERTGRKLAKVEHLLQEEASGKQVWKGSQAWRNLPGLSKSSTVLVGRMASRSGSLARIKPSRLHGTPVLASADDVDVLLQKVRGLRGNILFYEQQELERWDLLLVNPGKLPSQKVEVCSEVIEENKEAKI